MQQQSEEELVLAANIGHQAQSCLVSALQKESSCVGMVSGVSNAPKSEGMGSLAHSGTTRIGSVSVVEAILTACYPKKHSGTTPGQSHPSRQGLPVSGSRMSLSSCQGAFQTSHFHLPQ